MKILLRNVLLLTLGLIPTGLFAFDAPYANDAPVIDGDPSDIVWSSAKWVHIDQVILGAQLEKEDFSGRYKLVWNEDHLYMLAEISDDVLHDSHPDTLDSYWEDDTLEIFGDEDASGGDHLLNYNAFAYQGTMETK